MRSRSEGGASRASSRRSLASSHVESAPFCDPIATALDQSQLPPLHSRHDLREVNLHLIANINLTKVTLFEPKLCIQ